MLGFFFLEFYFFDEIKFVKFYIKFRGLLFVVWNFWIDLRERDDVKSFNVSFLFGFILEYF